MKSLTFYIFYLIFWQINIQAQHLTFGSGISCKVGTDICGISNTGKAQANVKMQYELETGELVLIFDRQQLELANRRKLLAARNQTVKNAYLYTFTYDNPLPPEIVQNLGLKGNFFIRKGTYPVQVQKNRIILRVKLLRK